MSLRKLLKGLYETNMQSFWVRDHTGNYVPDGFSAKTFMGETEPTEAKTYDEFIQVDVPRPTNALFTNVGAGVALFDWVAPTGYNDFFVDIFQKDTLGNVTYFLDFRNKEINGASQVQLTGLALDSTYYGVVRTKRTQNIVVNGVNTVVKTPSLNSNVAEVTTPSASISHTAKIAAFSPFFSYNVTEALGPLGAVFNDKSGNANHAVVSPATADNTNYPDVVPFTYTNGPLTVNSKAIELIADGQFLSKLDFPLTGQPGALVFNTVRGFTFDIKFKVTATGSPQRVFSFVMSGSGNIARMFRLESAGSVPYTRGRLRLAGTNGGTIFVDKTWDPSVSGQESEPLLLNGTEQIFTVHCYNNVFTVICKGVVIFTQTFSTAASGLNFDSFVMGGHEPGAGSPLGNQCKGLYGMVNLRIGSVDNLGNNIPTVAQVIDEHNSTNE